MYGMQPPAPDWGLNHSWQGTQSSNSFSMRPWRNSQVSPTGNLSNQCKRAKPKLSPPSLQLLNHWVHSTTKQYIGHIYGYPILYTNGTNREQDIYRLSTALIFLILNYGCLGGSWISRVPFFDIFVVAFASISQHSHTTSEVLWMVLCHQGSPHKRNITYEVGPLCLLLHIKAHVT